MSARAVYEALTKLKHSARPDQVVVLGELQGALDGALADARAAGREEGTSLLRDAAIFAEIDRATVKFPTWPTHALHAVAVVNEEVGELNKAILQAIYEPHKSGPAEVRAEAIQAAAMAIRFVRSLNAYSYSPSTQHSQGAER